MKVLQYIIPLVTGAFIGYITNWIAIKMLFRPYEEKYIGKIRLPFTPGLIPKERRRISQSISATISEYLLTDIMVIRELKSDRIKGQLKVIINNAIEKLNLRELSVSDVLQPLFGEKKEEIIKAMRLKITQIIYDSFNKDIKKQVSELVFNATSDKLMNNTLEGLLGEDFYNNIKYLSSELSPKILSKIKLLANSKEVEDKIYHAIKQEVDKKMAGMGFLGMLGGGLVNPQNISSIVIERINLELEKDSTKDKLEEIIFDFINDYKNEKIDELIPENYKLLIFNKIEEFVEEGISNNITYSFIEEFVDAQTKIILTKKIHIHDHIKSIIISRFISLYDIIISRHANEFIKTIQIERIIEREINAFKTEHLEKIIVKVAHKELSAITKLGALIGFVLAGVILIF